ncbi:hypothetical protein HanRHA438_Chr02g0080081 [Helianthus annuus]|nr:hypothetical protein HanRHA438_Chr02g0080081 [Helianthus annuus]
MLQEEKESEEMEKIVKKFRRLLINHHSIASHSSFYTIILPLFMLL